MRLIAFIEQADVIRRFLHYPGLPPDVPEPAPQRAPPRVDDRDDRGDDVVSGIEVDARRTSEPAIDDPC